MLKPAKRLGVFSRSISHLFQHEREHKRGEQVRHTSIPLKLSAHHAASLSATHLEYLCPSIHYALMKETFPRQRSLAMGLTRRGKATPCKVLPFSIKIPSKALHQYQAYV